MNDIATPPQTVPPGASQVAPGDVSIPEVSSNPGGAQGVRPAPAGTIPAPILPASERPGSAKQQMLERMRARSKPVEGAKPAEAQDKANQGKAAEQRVAERAADPEKAAADDDDPMDGEVAKAEEKKAEPAKDEKAATEAQKTDEKAAEKKDKPNPWKLVEENKARAAALEKEVVELKKMIGNPELRKRELEEVESIKKRNQELEEHIRFVDYQQSAEYKEKYEKPYQQQWHSTMRELKGVTVETDEGPRDISANDVLDLVNLPLARARQAAIERFGDFADDVMAHRQKIRDLFDARQGALEAAKREGSEKFERLTKEQQAAMEDTNRTVKAAYDAAVESIKVNPKHSKFISEREGDEEGNALLQKGYELVDRAFAANPMAPGLTAEQRAKIVKQHAAVRHKAAAYTRLVRDLSALQSDYEKIRQELDSIKGTQPNFQPSRENGSQAAASGSKMDQMRARLRKLAKPV